MIQIFKPKYHVEECLIEIKDSLERGWTGLGDKTIKFEDAWKKYTGYNNCHFLNSATSGLHLAINILKEEYGWDNDDEIISTSITFVSTNHAILYENMKIKFADVDENLCLDANSVFAKINSNTKAILFVGLGGNIGQYEKIVEICKVHKLILILDAAHMSGSRYKGEIIGKEADVVINSFQAVKNLPIFDAGMISFKEEKFDKIARKKSWLGIDKDTFSRSQGNYKWDYDVNYTGFKYHGNSIAAGIGLVELNYLDESNAYRRELATKYINNLSNIQFINHINKDETSQHLYQIIINNRDEVLEKLHADGINCGVHYKSNTEYKMYSHLKEAVPFADALQHKILSLPLHLELTESDVNFISEKIIGYIK
jgi:dTDP-4-amino-4,6-dideoxygalactose transaminase